VPAAGAEPGAYGLRIKGLRGAQRWMQPVPAGAPELRVQVRRGTPRPCGGPGWALDGRHVFVDLVPNGSLHMALGSAVARYVFPAPHPPSDLLHPYLAAAVAVAHGWMARETIHGGAIVTPRGAIMVLGGREDGKSSTLAWLSAELGVPVLTDDLCVVGDGAVLAGPRCIDLRAPTVRRYGARWDVGPARGSARFRLALPPAPDRAEVVGTAVLRWGDRLRCAEVRPHERLAEIGSQRAFGPLDADPATVLDLAALPMIALERPATLGSLPRAAEALLAAWA